MRKVGCAVLAAGAGARFGSPGEKLVAPLDGKPLLAHAIDAASASAASECTLILGAGAQTVRSRVDARRCPVFINLAWADGLSSSIKLAIALHETDDACILMLGDQPHVAVNDLDALIDTAARHPRSIIALRLADVWGAPVLFPSADFQALARLRGDAGAKRYAQSQRKRLRFVEALRADAFDDVDTREDIRIQSGSESPYIRRSQVRR